MCSTGLLKTMMFIFNGIIFLAGAAILTVGIWVKVDSGSLMLILGNIDAPSSVYLLSNVRYLLFAVGAVLLVIGFLGCCGAVKESRCMLLTFFCIVLIIFIIVVAAAIVLFIFQHSAEPLIGSLEEKVRDVIRKNYGNVNDTSITKVWNTTMKQFECCGFMNYTDFNSSPFVTNSGLYPPTCCNSTVIGNSTCNKNGAADSHMPGCFVKLVEFIEDNAVIVAAVALGIAALEIAAIVVTMILYKDIG